MLPVEDLSLELNSLVRPDAPAGVHRVAADVRICGETDHRVAATLLTGGRFQAGRRIDWAGRCAVLGACGRRGEPGEQAPLYWMDRNPPWWTTSVTRHWREVSCVEDCPRLLVWEVEPDPWFFVWCALVGVVALVMSIRLRSRAVGVVYFSPGETFRGPGSKWRVRPLSEGADLPFALRRAFLWVWVVLPPGGEVHEPSGVVRRPRWLFPRRGTVIVLGERVFALVGASIMREVERGSIEVSWAGRRSPDPLAVRLLLRALEGSVGAAAGVVALGAPYVLSRFWASLSLTWGFVLLSGAVVAILIALIRRVGGAFAGFWAEALALTGRPGRD